MFGFSIFKVFFTIAVIVLVWQGFKWLKRRESMIDARAKESVGCKPTDADDGVEEMRPCPDCGAYLVKGSFHSCTYCND